MSDRERYRGALPHDEWEAYKDLKRALLKNTAPWFKRSEEADKAKSTPYFATPIELAARAFERTIRDRLEARLMTNDFLANIMRRWRLRLAGYALSAANRDYIGCEDSQRPPERREARR